jgi:hypothetical protein
VKKRRESCGDAKGFGASTTENLRRILFSGGGEKEIHEEVEEEVVVEEEIKEEVGGETNEVGSAAIIENLRRTRNSDEVIGVASVEEIEDAVSVVVGADVEISTTENLRRTLNSEEEGEE